MWIHATLTQADLEDALRQVLPTKLALHATDPDRYLWVDLPSSVTTSDRGLRIETNARLQWEVIGVPVPITLRCVIATITPVIQQQQGRDVLALQAHVDDADLSAVPAFVESSLLARVNEALAQPNAQIVWDYAKTLDFHFKLPERISPKRTLRLHATEGTVTMADAEIVIGARFDLEGTIVQVVTSGDAKNGGKTIKEADADADARRRPAGDGRDAAEQPAGGGTSPRKPGDPPGDLEVDTRLEP